MSENIHQADEVVHEGVVSKLTKDMDDLNAKVYGTLANIELAQETTNQHLQDTMMQFRDLNTTYNETRKEVAWLRKRLAGLLPEPNNCSKCGTKLLKASKKCPCGHQN